MTALRAEVKAKPNLSLGQHLQDWFVKGQLFDVRSEDFVGSVDLTIENAVRHALEGDFTGVFVNGRLSEPKRGPGSK